MNVWIIFLTGLTTGGLSCLAVQGGLLTSIIANQKEAEVTDEVKAATQTHKLSRKERRKQKDLQTVNQHRNSMNSVALTQLDWVPVMLFLVSKLCAYTVLGFLLGWIGAKLQLTLTIRLIFQGLAALFMFGTAMNLLNIHPLFRYLIIQPPRFVRKWLKNTTQGEAFFTPAVLGLMTIFIPCGVTQSMEVLAISSGNPWVGAITMGVFVLGTSPLFVMIGVATAKLSDTFQDRFMKFAALALIYLSVVSMNGILVVLNSPITLSTLTSPITYFFSDERFAAGSVATRNNVVQIQNNVQQVVIHVTDKGYEPNVFQVKAGVLVQLTVSTNNTYSCASTFLMKAFHISLQLGPTDTQTVSFTPTVPGEYPFNCSMGMYKGVMQVI